LPLTIFGGTTPALATSKDIPLSTPPLANGYTLAGLSFSG